MKTIQIKEKLTPEIGNKIIQQIQTETDCEVIIHSSLVKSEDLKSFLEKNFEKGSYTVKVRRDIFRIKFGSLASSK